MRRAIVDVLVSVTGSALFVLLTVLWHAVPLAIALSIGATLACTISFFLILMRVQRKANIGLATELGLCGIWRDEAHFARHHGISYAEYCLKRVRSTPDGQEVRVVGYDWVELFSDTTLLGDEVFGEDGTSRLRFRVVLVDPDCAAPLEKRAWEMRWADESGDAFYPEGTEDESMRRLSTKVGMCVQVARIFQDQRPQYFDLKLTPVLPAFAMLMTEEVAIGALYSLPHKGKDSVLFEVRRRPAAGSQTASQSAGRVNAKYGGDLYGFLRGYFDAIWQDPDWRCSTMLPASRCGAAQSFTPCSRGTPQA